MSEMIRKTKRYRFCIIYFAIAVLILIQMVSACFLAQAAVDSYADWMSEHKEQLKGFPINQVTLLGSHDSSSCDIHVGSPPVSGYLTHSGHHKKGCASLKDVGIGGVPVRIHQGAVGIRSKTH